MAEQEVIKHTKNVFKIWGTDKSFWHKLGDFFLEIIIIVFAVSLSIYLHDLSEKKHKNQEAKEFLLGLREDLKMDIVEMNEDKKAFTLSRKAAEYFTKLKINETLHPDSVKLHFNWLVNTTALVPNNSRFEGFRSAGKIGTIHNIELQNNIMELYQENIPNLLASSNLYNLKKIGLNDFIIHNRKRITDSSDNLEKILKSDVVYYTCRNIVFVGEILARYDSCIATMKAINNEIGIEYGQ